MTKASTLRSGKGHRDENFPVASRLLSAADRPPILAFYEFVRTADDIADHSRLRPTEKFALLDDLEAALLGKRDTQPAAVALRNILAEPGLESRHAREMLTAFRRDVTRRRYRTWDELMEYCRYSAMPVGRFVLEVCGEDQSLWPASDALCAALQVINHLQDCSGDYRRLGRVYLPLDMLSSRNADVAALGSTISTPQLRRCIDDICDRVDELLARSAGLGQGVQHVRLGLEIAVIQRLAERLVLHLRSNDPLVAPVRLSATETTGLAMIGITDASARRVMQIVARSKHGSGVDRTSAPSAPSERPAAAAASHSSFYAAMRILPARKRQAIFEIYAFCRAVDDIADKGGDRRQRREQLQAWRQRIRSLYAPNPAVDCAGLAQAAHEFGLEPQDFLSVIDGMEMDVIADIRAPDTDTLDLYCDRVASAVGRLCVRVFGMEERQGIRLAHHLGRALQLTNILRDLDEDAEIGRLYLPREALAKAGIALTEPVEVLAHPALGIACRQVAEQAVEHFGQADAIMAAAPRSVVRAPHIMSNAYRAILDRMMNRGWRPPRRRPRLSRTQMVRIALRSLVL